MSQSSSSNAENGREAAQGLERQAGTSLSDFFIRRPVTTTLLTLAVVCFGLLGYFKLPVSNLPNVEYPTLSVSASLPGADPETMAATVATPLERRFSSVPGVTSMNSTSSFGSTQITLQFDLNRNIDAAAQDVQAAIAAAARQLPPAMPNPPSYRKVDPAAQPIFFLALSSPTLPLPEVDELAETRLAQRLSMVPGVSQVSIFGAQKYAVRAQADPSALAARGLGLDEVASAMRRGSSNEPSGTLRGPSRSLGIRTDAQLTNAEGYRDLILAYRNGQPIRLREVARVVDSVENTQSAAWFNQQRGIVLAIERQPGSNTIDVVDGIRTQLPALREELPAAVSLDILYDRSESIRESVRDVQLTLLLTMGLVVLVIFLFLRNGTATAIPALALPVSILGTFGAMAIWDFSLDNLSLMALTLATGFVVDDAIVMLENIARHTEQGEDRMTAARRGAGEIGFTIVAMTVSLVAVFIPLLFLGGIVGRLFHEFAVVLTIAILLSGVVSLTLTPMLASRFLAPPRHPAPGAPQRRSFLDVFERGFDATLGFYQRSLDFVLRHRRAGLVAFFALIALTGVLYQAVPKGFIPSEDIGMIRIQTRGQEGLSFAEMVRHQEVAAAIVAKDPNVAAFMSNVGAGMRSTSVASGSMFVRLKPREERQLSADGVIRELRGKLSRIPGLQVTLLNPPAIRIGGMSSRSLYQLSLTGLSPREVGEAAQALQAELAKLPELQDVTSDQDASSPQLQVSIKRDEAAALGVSPEQIATALSQAFGDRQVSTIFTSTNDYQVILELAPEFQTDPSALHQLYLRAANGRMVPLSAVTTAVVGVAPEQVQHVGQMPASTISFDLRPGTSLDAATAAVERVARATLPPGIEHQFQGTAQVFQSSFGNLGVLLLLSVGVIYIVLGVLYESFWHPLTVLSGLPSAGLGALLVLLVAGKELDLYGFIGLVLLIGIVKKNAIMMIDFAIEARRDGQRDALSAIREACLVRFRPIMMTTFAALMGALPIALGLGAGGEARQSLGLAVAGGLLVSQVLTLYLTPVVYVFLDRFQRQPRAAEAAPNEAGELTASVGTP